MCHRTSIDTVNVFLLRVNGKDVTVSPQFICVYIIIIVALHLQILSFYCAVSILLFYLCYENQEAFTQSKAMTIYKYLIWIKYNLN